jgi:hypothetical protein
VRVQGINWTDAACTTRFRAWSSEPVGRTTVPEAAPTGGSVVTAGVTMTGGAAISIDGCGPTDRIYANGFD